MCHDPVADHKSPIGTNMSLNFTVGCGWIMHRAGGEEASSKMMMDHMSGLSGLRRPSGAFGLGHHQLDRDTSWCQCCITSNWAVTNRHICSNSFRSGFSWTEQCQSWTDQIAWVLLNRSQEFVLYRSARNTKSRERLIIRRSLLYVPGVRLHAQGVKVRRRVQALRLLQQRNTRSHTEKRNQQAAQIMGVQPCVCVCVCVCVCDCVQNNSTTHGWIFLNLGGNINLKFISRWLTFGA